MKNAKKLRRKLDYLPSWAWYVLSLCIAGPVGPVVVYLLFYALDKAVKEENESERNGTDWNVDIDRDGIHVRGRSRNRGNAWHSMIDPDSFDGEQKLSLSVITGAAE